MCVFTCRYIKDSFIIDKIRIRREDPPTKEKRATREHNPTTDSPMINLF